MMSRPDSADAASIDVPAGPPPPWWTESLDDADATVLRRYQRPRSQPVRWDRAALIVVDVVDSFVGPDVPVAEAQRYARTACGHSAWRALPAIARLVEAFRTVSRPVVYTVIDSPHGGDGGSADDGVDAKPSPRGDVIHPMVAPRPEEEVIPKRCASGFFATPLTSRLVENDVRTVVLAGCTTSGCVLASAVDASSLGFEVVVVREACFDRVDQLGRAALVTMDAKWARVWSLDAVLTQATEGE